MHLKPALKIVCKASPAHMLVLSRRWSHGVADGFFSKEVSPVRAPFPRISHQILDTLRSHKIALCTCHRCCATSIPAFHARTPQRFNIKAVPPRIKLALTRTPCGIFPLRFRWEAKSNPRASGCPRTKATRTIIASDFNPARPNHRMVILPAPRRRSWHLLTCCITVIPPHPDRHRRLAQPKSTQRHRVHRCRKIGQGVSAHLKCPGGDGPQAGDIGF